METDTEWIRVHVVRRLAMFIPSDAFGPDTDDGPNADALGPVRTTHLVFADGKKSTRHNDWSHMHLGKS